MNALLPEAKRWNSLSELLQNKAAVQIACKVVHETGRRHHLHRKTSVLPSEINNALQPETKR
jgi:hypothetical protein